MIGEGEQEFLHQGCPSDLSYAYKMRSLTQVDPQDLPDQPKDSMCRHHTGCFHNHVSSNSQEKPGRKGSHCSHFTDDKTEA